MSESDRSNSGVRSSNTTPSKRAPAQDPTDVYAGRKTKHQDGTKGHSGKSRIVREPARAVKRPRDITAAALEDDPEWQRYVAHAIEIECPRCSRSNGPDAVQCAACGYALVVICPHCGASNLKFDGLTDCLSCDQPLYDSAAEQPPEDDPQEIWEVGEFQTAHVATDAGRHAPSAIGVFLTVWIVLAVMIFVIATLLGVDVGPPLLYIGLAAAIALVLTAKAAIAGWRP